MARRAYWKGYLRLSLVQCPIALHPATTEREKITFHQINRKTGHRIRYQKVDAETGKPVDPDDIVMGYEVHKGEFIQITDEELEAIALESRHTIDIDKFVPKREIDDLYKMRPYYIVPDGDVGAQAFAVIRNVIERTGRVALGRVVLTSREHVIALEARDKGLVGLLLRYPYEIVDANEVFAEIEDVKVPRDMIQLAEHIVRTKSGHFHPEEFEDHYENALRELFRRKRKGERIEPKKRAEPSNVVNLRDALRRSLEAEGGRRPPPARRSTSARHHPARRSGNRPRKAG
jgi:DNA end-binding protein Ku